MFPIVIDDQETCDQFIQIFPELKNKYSKDAVYSLEISANVHDNQAVQFSKQHAIQVGQHGSIDIILGLNVDGTTTSGENIAETAFKLQMSPAFHLDLLVQDYYAHVNVDSFKMQNAQLIENNAGLYHRDYDVLFSNLVQLQVDQVLSEYGAAGIPLIKDVNQYNTMNVYFSNSTVTTAQFDEYLYLGMTPMHN